MNANLTRFFGIAMIYASLIAYAFEGKMVSLYLGYAGLIVFFLSFAFMLFIRGRR
ncbi:hypothetical protein [Ensifer aridi]|uniref:hypothetical protein n=1 Tax=Ensifer aridi TaxID=1708715 RepID=UPI0015E3629E|nr:hypothetical protein [Ensifer aridi]